MNQSPYYLRARYYDPLLGRFLTRDPWPANALDPQSLNRYAYVLNNPALLVDPTGLVCLGRFCSSVVTDPVGGVAGYISDKAQDFNTGTQDTLNHPETALQNALAFDISLFSTGDRQTFQNGFVYYQNCSGLCNWVSDKILQGIPEAYTPGYISFGTGEIRQSTVWHEYQHYLQSQMLGPLYIPGLGIAMGIYGYKNSPFEVDARRAENCGESHAPFDWPNKSISRYSGLDWMKAFWRTMQ